MSFNPLLPELSAQTGFALSPLDRMSEIREDKQILADMSAAAGTRYIVIGRDRPILKRVEDGYDPFFTAAEAATVGRQRETVLLGKGTLGPHADVAFYAIVLDDSAVDIVEVADEGGLIDTRKFVVPGRNDLFVHDLRALATEGTLPVDIIGVLGQAKSIMHWHARHRFCSNCGSSSEMAAAGWRRECRSCKAMHFPRTDPVVIMLAISGDDCLMGRAGRFGKHMYSALAGFLEPGETIEDAVRREIREESSIRIGRVAYLASQPWPFPASLMIGCVAEALNRNIVIDKNELEDCRWFSRRDVQMMLKREHPDGYTAPHPLAIAHHLLRAWSEGRTPSFR
jgi:NAD+ diphosphatase